MLFYEREGFTRFFIFRVLLTFRYSPNSILLYKNTLAPQAKVFLFAYLVIFTSFCVNKSK